MTFSDTPTYASLRARILVFNEERDWAKFHSPKNLVMALVTEAGELNRLFENLTADDTLRVLSSASFRQDAADEIADVLSLLINLCDKLRIPLEPMPCGDMHYGPKSLVMVLMSRVAHLNELFQWLNEKDSYTAAEDSPLRYKVMPRIAEVHLALVQVAAKLRIDPLAALADKIPRNAAKYPVDKARGRSDKYDTY